MDDLEESIAFPIRASSRGGFLYPNAVLLDQLLADRPILEGLLSPRVQTIVIESA